MVAGWQRAGGRRAAKGGSTACAPRAASAQLLVAARARRARAGVAAQGRSCSRPRARTARCACGHARGRRRAAQVAASRHALARGPCMAQRRPAARLRRRQGRAGVRRRWPAAAHARRATPCRCRTWPGAAVTSSSRPAMARCSWIASTRGAGRAVRARRHAADAGAEPGPQDRGQWPGRRHHQFPLPEQPQALADEWLRRQGGPDGVERQQPLPGHVHPPAPAASWSGISAARVRKAASRCSSRRTRSAIESTGLAGAAGRCWSPPDATGAWCCGGRGRAAARPLDIQLLDGPAGHRRAGRRMASAWRWPSLRRPDRASSRSGGTA